MRTAKATKTKEPTTRSIGARLSLSRSHDESSAATLTDLGCPDCRGVLAVVDTSIAGVSSFRCRVGHAFSPESLVAAKEDQVEQALWSLVVVYEEMVLLHRALAERAMASHETRLARAYEARAERAASAARSVRRVLEEDGAAGAEGSA